ncbi:MAG TPA: class I SAM-dependent methyltransferase [Burkholderiales bacterium]|nr:class I SAM-dependent methyltransferase [Burkholderiales bacterium]
MQESISSAPNRSPSCAFCNSRSLEQIVDFGRVALAGGFIKPEHFDDEPRFPLRVFFCNDCYAVQVVDVVDVKMLFGNYFYFSSATRTLRDHFLDYAHEVVPRFLDPGQSTVVEIGCNDGVLLRPLADLGVRTLVGVDPATNIVATVKDPRIAVINDFFGKRVAEQIAERYGRADLIVANNVYAHIPDIVGVTEGIRDLLKDDGVFIFEVHHLLNITQGMQYDMIYHEHLYYYSLLALINHFRRRGMTVFDVSPVQIHAGSMRYFVCRESSRHAAKVSERVAALRHSELAAGLDRAETFFRFAHDIALRKERLMELLRQLRAKGHSVAGYGASGRANTIIQYCGIGREHLEYMIDDAPAKWGYYTPGSHFLIRSNDALRESRPDYLLVFAWGYFREIAERCRDYLEAGGRMIVPLPEVRLIVHPLPGVAL